MQREAWNSSLGAFCVQGLDYVDINPFTHGDMLATLEAPTPRKLVIMPRGSLKSSVSSVGFPIWCLNRNPNHRILLVSELYKNSKNLMREIKAHMESPRLTKVFGDYKTDSLWNESEIIIKQRTKVFKEASITCAGLGTQKTGQHYDICILDDLNSEKNTNNPENAQKVIDYYRYLTSIMEPTCIIVIVATRYSALDLPGFVIDNLLGDEQRESVRTA